MFGIHVVNDNFSVPPKTRLGCGGRISRVAGVGRLVGGDREDAPGGRVPHGLRALAHDHLLVHLPWRVHLEDGHGERSRSQLLFSQYVQ